MKKVTEQPGQSVDTTDVLPAEVERSGAPDVPAIDNHPRADQPKPEIANRIDFNDPSLSGAEAVEKNLAEQAGK